jgi:hypothetical protein
VHDDHETENAQHSGLGSEPVGRGDRTSALYAAGTVVSTGLAGMLLGSTRLEKLWGYLGMNVGERHWRET